MYRAQMKSCFSPWDILKPERGFDNYTVCKTFCGYCGIFQNLEYRKVSITFCIILS